MTKTDVTLMPCPFCGGQATKQEHHWRDGNFWGGAPFCKKCGAQMPRYWPQRETAEADNAWNTRTTPSAAPDGLAMTIEPTEEDIIEALRLSIVRSLETSGVDCGVTIPDYNFAHARTLAKLRNAEMMIADRDAEIEALRRFADLYTVKLPKTEGVGVMDLNPPYIWNGIPVQTSRGGKT